MCGIIAYKGKNDAVDFILEGLKKLEYRGYDSWGIAVKDNSTLNVAKKTGKIGLVSKKEVGLKKSSMGMGHTRWATHGGVTIKNAHPHLDCEKKIAVVHNGIIENYQELKKKLKGHTFVSESDTEVLPHLIEENIKLGLKDALRKAVKKIDGRSAVVAMNVDSDEIIAVRKGSPLIVGVADDGYFIASDVPAFLKHTNKVMYIDDGEMVVINKKPTFYRVDTGEEIKKRVIEIDWEAEQAEKKGYEHFLIKEIMEQKETLIKAINQPEDKIMKIADEINKAKGTFFVGCGTAGKVCLASEYFFSKIAHKHVNACFASEFPNYHHFLTDKTLMITISQSGETADVLEAIEAAKKENVKIVSLLNVFGSSMMRCSDDYLMINAGVEQAVASTKATTAQMAVVMLLAYASVGKLKEGKRVLMNAASSVNDMLNPRYEGYIKKLAQKVYKRNDMFIIGRALNYPMALESAIKIQEVSYINAQGFAGGELKHGPIALISEGTPCIALVPNDETKKDMLSNAIEIKARGGYIIGISPENNEIFDYWIKVPDAGDASPIVNLVPVQLLAYHLAMLLGRDPDKPRNLAKSVTVK
ncbi:MAG: glutamine--fructose-6-phosphate transaminase (isomerizing) [bacterium]|nr:glutamine--fructose-6-phosphate transaminase (isomerizing) [bacterium]